MIRETMAHAPRALLKCLAFGSTGESGAAAPAAQGRLQAVIHVHSFGSVGCSGRPRPDVASPRLAGRHQTGGLDLRKAQVDLRRVVQKRKIAHQIR